MPVRARIALALCLFALGEIPYARARAAAPPGHAFGGHVYYLDDLSMYFSFIRQAADGNWLFVDRLTHVPHAPAFFNLEWLAVGWILRACGSADAAFAAWRLAGVFALVFGFAALAAAAGLPTRVRAIALVAFAFGGGFGWIVTALEAAGFVPRLAALPALYWKLDLVAGVHPFLQSVLNPHFSLPHGLLLLFFAAYLRAQATQRPRDHALAAVLAAGLGFARPYDLALLWAALPLHAVVRADRGLTARHALGLLPLAASAPALAYHAWLFTAHPVFSHWARQGAPPAVPLACQLLGLGLAGVFLVVRLARPRAAALADGPTRLLLVWMIVVLVFVHAHTVLPGVPYASQLMTSLMAPVVLLAAPVLARVNGPALVALLAVNAISSGVLVAERTRAVSQPGYYDAPGDILAARWLAAHAEPTDVILSRRPAGNRLGRLVSARVALGHYSVTPDAARLEERVERFFAGAMAPAEAVAFVRELGVRWIYRSLTESPDLRAKELPGITRAYHAAGIVIYSVSSAQTRSGGSAHARGGRRTCGAVPALRTSRTRTRPRA
jgi:hypothetical protein